MKLSKTQKCPKCQMNWDDGINPETNKKISKLVKVSQMIEDKILSEHFECPYCRHGFRLEAFK